MRRFLLVAVLFALAVPAVACARASRAGGGPSGPTGIEHPTGAGDLILRIQTSGGFIAPQATLTAEPTFSLFGDGTVVTQGAQIEIYPGPAIPALIQTSVTEDGIQAILRAAKAAGLLGPDASYLDCAVPDVGTTTFTLNADGSTHTVTAAALGSDQGSGCSKDAAAREKLATFEGKLGDLRSWLPSGSVGEDAPYEFAQTRLYVQPYTPDPSVTEPQIDWPLSSDLRSFGDTISTVPDTRCGVVGGQDLDTLRPDLDKANQLTPWTSGSSEYTLLVQPLLPGQHAC
jgi:hypothetical protein